MRSSRHLLPAGLFGFTGVGLGAFGAHGFKATLIANASTSTWQTAVLYHLIHAIALWGAAIFVQGGGHPGRWLSVATVGWSAGIMLFSGSLYAHALGGPQWLVWITPFGGLCLLAGWIGVTVMAFPKTPPSPPATR